MRDALGGKLYNEVAANVLRLTGETVRSLRTRPDGAPGPGSIWYVPVFKRRARRGLLRSLERRVRTVRRWTLTRVSASHAPEFPRGWGGAKPLRRTFLRGGHRAQGPADRIVAAALEKDEFALLCQTIRAAVPRAPA